MENRRQHQAWEREALELVRSGLVEEAVAAYQAHDRVVCADSKPAAILALLSDWWAAWQQADHDPTQEVVVLAARRAEVDRLNTLCQELLAARGRLSPERLQVEDRQLAVGDRVVCGKNAIGLDLGRLSTAELRSERDRLRHQLDQAPRDRGRKLVRATAHRQQAEQVLAAHQPSTGRRPADILRWLRLGDEQPTRNPGGLTVATQQANPAHDRERELRQHQHRRNGWLEANAHLGPTYREIVRTLAWQQRATGQAVERERPGYVLEALGPVPESTRGRRAWRQAAAEIEQYRRGYQVTDPERALGPEPRDPTQRADRERARTAIARIHTKQRTTDCTRGPQPTNEHPSQPRPHQQCGRQGPERAAG